jgi:LemA protein
MKFRVAFALVPAVLLSACGLNSVPTAQENAKAKWADVQAAYQRRADLIPNLVATAKAASGGSENTILTKVTQARASAGAAQLAPGDLSDPAKVAAFQAAQSQLGSALKITVEAYPQLQSQKTFQTLQDQIEGSENRINIAIQDYNAAVQAYNTRIRTFPDSIGASVFYGAKPMVPFQAKAGADTAPTVEFGNNF